MRKRLQDRIKASMARWDAIEAAASEGDGRDFTADELAEIEKIRASVESDKAQLDAIDKREELKDSLTSPNRKTKQPNGTVTKLKDDGSIVVHDPEFTKDAKCGFETPVEFMCAVMEYNRSNNQTDDDRIKFLAAVGSDEQGAYAESVGGVFMPHGFSPNMLQLAGEGDPLMRFVNGIPMTTPSISIPARVDKDHSTSVSGGFTVSRSTETAAAAASQAEYEDVNLIAKELTGVAHVTDMLLEFSVVSFAAMVANSFGDEFGAAMMEERIEGTGVGEFMGILNSPCKVAVAKEGSQAADTLLFANLVKMRSRCWGYRRGGVWLYNQDALPQLMQMVDAGSNLIWQQSAREGEPDRILGRPAFDSEFAKTIGDEGDIICGNWSQYLQGTLTAMRRQESIHVRFLNNERTFKFTMRNAAAPWWRSAMTPKNSTNTLSPFVTLAARA